MNKIAKSAIVSSVLALAIVPIPFSSATAIAQAEQIKVQESSSQNILSSDELEFLLKNGATIQEINQLPENDKILKNGMIVEGNNAVFRGKWSSAAKLILKNYKKLPGWVKGIIGYGTAQTIAKKLEQLNGNLTDA